MKLHDGEHSWTIEVALRMLVEWTACVSLDIVSSSVIWASYGGSLNAQLVHPPHNTNCFSSSLIPEAHEQCSILEIRLVKTNKNCKLMSVCNL